MSGTKWNVYLLGELGALLGAVLAAPLAAVVVYGGLGLFVFESLEDVGRSVILLVTIGALVLIVGSSIGFWFALTRARFPAAKNAARMLFLLLVAFNLGAVSATSEGRVSVLVPVILIPFAMPPFAIWLTRMAKHSIAIEVFVVVLVGIGVYGAFARSNVVSLPVAQVTPPVEGEPSVPRQLPLGTENPCWAGTYPDDLAFLEAQEVPVRIFLVDLETHDIYYSDCVGRRLSQGDNWPPGVAERLVRSSDL